MRQKDVKSHQSIHGKVRAMLAPMPRVMHVASGGCFMGKMNQAKLIGADKEKA